MKRTLFQWIINETIKEGGNAVPSAKDVRGDIAGDIARDVIQSVSKAFNCHAEAAGSTGKKGSEMYSGDIDILMDMPWEDVNVEKVKQWVTDSFPGCEMKSSPGFKEISFGYPYHDDSDNVDKIAQVDLMFTGNINWRRWSAYSPSPYDEEYAEHGIDKAFKGLVQTVLLKAIASVVPLDMDKLSKMYPNIDFSSVPFTEGEREIIRARREARGRDDANNVGRNKSYWRYMWDAENGLVIIRKSYESKKRPGQLLIDATTHEKLEPETSDVDTALKLIFGNAATTEVLKNPITMIKYLFGGNYPYATPENLRRIHNIVTNNDQINEIPGAVENFEKVWNKYAKQDQERSQGEPAYSATIQEMRDLYNRMKKTED